MSVLTVTDLGDYDFYGFCGVFFSWAPFVGWTSWFERIYIETKAEGEVGVFVGKLGREKLYRHV